MTKTTTDADDLDAFLSNQHASPRSLMDKIPAEVRDLIVSRYQAGVRAPDLRAWASTRFPEIPFTQGNFDQWLYKNATRARSRHTNE